MSKDHCSTRPSPRRRASVHLAVAATLLLSLSSPGWAQVNANGPDAHDDGSVTRTTAGLMLNFRDASIDVVLDELSAAAGFIVVKEVRPQGRVTLVSRQPVDATEAVTLLNTVLRGAGYAAIRQERILKIVPADQAKRLNIPVRVGHDPTRIAMTDELITQVVPLRYADATQLRQDLQPLISAQADFASNASSNALVITDTSANIRRVVEIVAALDTSLADAVDVKVFQLKFANAAAAARLINDVFSAADISTQQGQEFVPPWRRAEQQQQQQQQQQQRGQRGATTRGSRVNAAADDRTNSIVVTGPADTLVVIEQIVGELDANPAADETVYVYRLRNAQSLNVEAVLNSLFNGTDPGTRSQQNTLQSARQGTQRTSRSSGTTIGTGGAFGQQTTTGRTGTAFAQTTGTGQTRLSTGAQQTASELAGQVAIIADPDTNSLLVRTSPANFERVREVIEELDRTVAQVLIKVLVAEVTHDNGLDFGAEFSILNIRPSGLGQEGGTSFNIPVAGAAATGMIVQVLEQNFTATIRALETEGKLDVLSRPYILASDNQLASITVGQEIPFITRSQLTDSGQTINTIEYGDVGILLDVVPHINPDGLVILDVAPEISTLTGTTVPISELVSAPVIAKRSAQSRVAVRSGQTIVIGGLMEDRVTQTINKVPLLGDIPIFGHAFKRTQTNKSKTELLIFLTPHVAADPNALEQMSEKELEGAKLVPGAVRRGVFDQHREGLRRGSDLVDMLKPMQDDAVEDMNRDEEEMEEGD
jgi:general secretion pathway protein D